MADKKVERSRGGHSFTPSQKLTASLSDQGTLAVDDARHDKGKAALVDKFREREERWRRDQSMHAREAASGAEMTSQLPEEAGSAVEPLAGGEGGAG